MKSTFALTTLTLLATTLAAPQSFIFDKITINVSNDISGANAAATVVADGTVNTLGNLLAGTNLVKNGRVIATSAQLTTVLDGLFCIFKDENQVPVGLLNTRITFTGLDGVEGKAVETDVTGFTFECQQ